MVAPKRKDDALHEDGTTISPNGDTTAERYAKVKEAEANMSMKERVKRIREAPSIFDFEPKPKKEKTEG